MEHIRLSCIIFLFSLFAGITSSCSQTVKSGGSSDPVIYEATTSCNNATKELLRIPENFKTEMIKWRLTLYHDAKTSAPSVFDLICTYGIGKPGTKGFMEGAKTIELKGKWTIDKTTKQNGKAVIYNLMDSSGISLSFLQPDQNLLHLLDKDDHLMIGTAAWSYTLNRIHPLISINRFMLQPANRFKKADSTMAGVFEGRTPCNSVLRKINEIPAYGCGIIKCRLVLYLDNKTHEPATFLFQTIYVGNGDDNKYSITGKWKLMQDPKYDPAVIFYQLEPDPPKSQTVFRLLKADNNILFFLDNDDGFWVGDQYTSYTLNRKKDK
jgi:hypothetical protein